MLAQHIGAQQEAGVSFGPQAIAEPEAVARLDQQHVRLVAGDALGAELAHFIEIGDAVVARLQQGRKRDRQLALLDQHDAALRPHGMHEVVVAEHMTRLTMERLDAFVLVRTLPVMGNARTGHAARAADDEGALEIVLARGLVDAHQPGSHFARIDRRT